MSNKAFADRDDRYIPAIINLLLQKNIVYPIVSALLIAAIWEGLVQILEVPQLILPQPSEIFIALFANWSTLQTATIQSLQYSLIGFIVGSLMGVFLAILIVYSKFIERTLQPVLLISFVVPKIAFAPLILLWYGAGPIYFTVMPVLLVFFPVMENTITGIRGIKNDLRDLGKLYNASRAFRYRNIIIPASLPHIMAGLKIGMTQSVIGVITAEFVAPERGLGYVLLLSETFGNPKLSFAAIIATGILGISLYKIVEISEHRLLFWRGSHNE